MVLLTFDLGTVCSKQECNMVIELWSPTSLNFSVTFPLFSSPFTHAHLNFLCPSVAPEEDGRPHQEVPDLEQ